VTRTFRAGTRGSDLARRQTEIVLSLLRHAAPELKFETIDLSTTGDDMAEAPLERMEGTGFFTSTLEQTLLAGEIDLAVHSFKDLPVAAAEGLTVAAVPERARPEDALCTRDGQTLMDLPAGARVGTSSLRRTAQLRALRSDLSFPPLRGNVPTRLERVARGELDGVTLAAAGLERLGLLDRASEIFPIERIIPAPAQGAIAVQIRSGDDELSRAVAAIDHAPTHRAVLAERTLLHELRGGCSVPVGGFARFREDRLMLRAGVFAPSGDRTLMVEVEGTDPRNVGREAARRLLQAGADDILAALEREPRLAWEKTR
jgi:hydroxymethylbilane synthase